VRPGPVAVLLRHDTAPSKERARTSFSGKTKVLAHRVAHLILSGRDPQRLLTAQPSEHQSGVAEKGMRRFGTTHAYFSTASASRPCADVTAGLLSANSGYWWGCATGLIPAERSIPRMGRDRQHRSADGYQRTVGTIAVAGFGTHAALSALTKYCESFSTLKASKQTQGPANKRLDSRDMLRNRTTQQAETLASR
jgi:hypothetical protein